jgi:hypothetical protein
MRQARHRPDTDDFLLHILEISMNSSLRPTQAKVFVTLMLVSAAVMAMLGWSASAYYFPAACLLVQAFLLWRGAAFGLFRGILLINQISGLVLILVLWLGDGLGNVKLDISGVSLLVNLLCGGPLMAILAIGLLPALHKGKPLAQWFNPQGA